MQAGTDKMHLLQQLSSRTRRFSMLPNDSRWKETQDGNDVLRWREVSPGRHDFFPGLLGLVSSTQGTDQLAILNALSDDDYQGRIESAGVTVSE